MAIVITGTSITAPDGAIDAADLTGTLPALNGSALTSIAAANLTGTLPALDASSLTGLSSGDPVPQNFDPSATPDEEFLVSGTWTKPSGYSDTDWVTFYLVGGGGGGSAPADTGNYWRVGGAGGMAHVWVAKINSLPDTLTVTIGAGGGNNASGGQTRITDSDGNYISAGGGGAAGPSSTSRNGGGGTLTNWPASIPNPLEGKPSIDAAGSANYGQYQPISVKYGGGAGQGGTSGSSGSPGGASLYSGDGGAYGQPGVQPGGGGAGGPRGTASNGLSGGDGSVRIYYG